MRNLILALCSFFWIGTAFAADNDVSLSAALALQPADFAKQSPERLNALAEWLTAWSFLGATAEVPGDTPKYIEALEKARLMFAQSRKLAPKNPESYWLAGETNYMIGELLPDTAKERRAKLYEEIIALARACLKDIDPNDPGCNHFLATGMGRLATTRGVLASMRSAAEIERSWKRGLDANPSRVLVWGDPLKVNIQYGLGVYYRMAPDWWIMKVMLGTRGDKKKAVALFKAASAAQPFRLELQKEYAVALLCLGTNDDDDKALAAGKALMKRIVAGEFDTQDVRATDPIDKKHAAEMLAAPEKACGYSRDGYQEIDRDKAESMYKKE